MPTLRTFFFFIAIYFLLCPILLLMIYLMKLSYAGFQTIHLHYYYVALLLPPVGFFILCYLIRKHAPQSDGSGYFDIIDLLEKKATPRATLGGKIVPEISYRDFVARFLLTPLSALFGVQLVKRGQSFIWAAPLLCCLNRKSNCLGIF